MKLTVDVILRQLLPEGSGGKPSGDAGDLWSVCPFWPPDVFGVAATVAEKSGCYVEPGVVLSQDAAGRAAKRELAEKAMQLGRAWSLTSASASVPQIVQDLWNEMLSSRHEAICEPGSGGWKAPVMRLLAISDEASSGFGYIPPEGEDSLMNVVFRDLNNFDVGGKPLFCALPHSIAKMIPADRACIMPKALTPTVGCTLRSLSHNLALLPGVGTVRPLWFISTTDLPGRQEDAGAEIASEQSGPAAQATEPPGGDRYNVLVIPFPYDLAKTDFRVDRQPESGPIVADGYFTLDQAWLTDGAGPLPRENLTQFVAELIRRAAKDLGSIQAIVLPETALDRAMAGGLIEDLANTFPDLELVICGILHNVPEARLPRNQAVLSRLSQGTLARNLLQSKHHRWKLDRAQIAQYQLGRQLDPSHSWWESIDVSDRQIAFGVIRNDAVFAALICEDLARFDPVLPVINAVGPNLVVALLMDGPQLRERWPGRYATVLADDPGSSVLSVTCLGMVKMARRHGEEVRRTIGLWKDSDTGATELVLPMGSLALALSLKLERTTQRTMDFRTDHGMAVKLKLAEVLPVGLLQPPDWLARG